MMSSNDKNDAIFKKIAQFELFAKELVESIALTDEQRYTITNTTRIYINEILFGELGSFDALCDAPEGFFDEGYEDDGMDDLNE